MDSLFSGEQGTQRPPPWKLMVVDDDADVQTLTKMVLRKFSFEGRELQFLCGYSGADAKRLIGEHPDTALILLDVIMENDRAGLEVVRFIREELKNPFVRIILRTGQAGQVPEKEVIADFDINGYEEKADLSARRLVTAVTTGLRAYRDLRTIEHLSLSNVELERRVSERTAALTSEIAQRKKTEEHLRKSQESLARAQSVAHLGNWDWECGGGMSWSDEVFCICGVNPARVVPSLESLLDFVHAEDRERVSSVLETARHQGKPFGIEHRIVRSDGSERTVRQLGEVFLNEQGHPCRVVGTLHDITSLREIETRLKIASQVFMDAMEEAADQLTITTQIFENALEGMMVTDTVGVIQSVNPAFTTITGFTAQEAVGNTPSLLRSDRQDNAFYAAMWKEIREKGQWSGEIWNRRKSGEAYPQWLSITTIRNNQGEVARYVGVFHDLTDIKRSKEELHFKTYHDNLTGLPNRELFKDRLQQALRQANRSARQVALLVFDLDFFKNVNNSLGHAAGDRILQEAAHRLGSLVREGDTTSRISGDSFAIILRDLQDVQSVVVVVGKLIAAMGRPFVLDGKQLFVTASVGITLFPGDGNDADTLIQNADIAVNRAKKAGRNTYQFYTQGLAEQASHRMEIENDLRKALEQDEFILYYQPKVSIESGRIVGMEALVRWNHPVKGMISPGEFIPVTEESGLIVPLGAWILRTACRESKPWFALPDGPKRVAINLSARQFQQPDLIEVIEGILAEAGLPPEHLELEITESMVMGDVENAICTLTALKERGIHIAVDDFGTGYSSLNYLKRFPIHTLKIDQSFVRDLANDTDDAAIVSAIISLARNLRLNVVAEGVETHEHLAFLRKNRCNEIQGYLFSRPLPAEQFAALLHEKKTLSFSSDPL